MTLVDTHAHLYWDSYKEDLDQVITRAKESNVGLIINIGTDLQTSQQAIDLTSAQIEMYATVGIHPHDTGDVSKLEELYQKHSDKIVAIGECGLDFSQEATAQQKEEQKSIYKAQATLAKKLNLPLVIHCRDAWDEIFIPELEGTTGVFHTFSGTTGDAQKALELGYYLSFSCTLTYPKNEDLRQILKDFPLNKIVTETDCPFLPPQQIRGERNEPAHVSEVVKVISEIKSIPEKDIAEAVYSNTIQLFRLNSYNQ